MKPDIAENFEKISKNPQTDTGNNLVNNNVDFLKIFSDAKIAVESLYKFITDGKK